MPSPTRLTRQRDTFVRTAFLKPGGIDFGTPDKLRRDPVMEHVQECPTTIQRRHDSARLIDEIRRHSGIRRP